MELIIQSVESYYLLIATFALWLGLPRELEYRAQIITAAFGGVAFSISVQGVPMTPLLRGLKV